MSRSSKPRRPRKAASETLHFEDSDLVRIIAGPGHENFATLEREGSVAGWGEREGRELWRRLRPISDAMRCETLQWEPGFQGDPGLTPFSKLPPALLEMGEDLTAAVFSDRPAL